MEAIRTKSARHKFRAERDENGVPHVEAATWNEALYAWGYMHAVDRPTQVYFARAIASGQATERIANKPELLEADVLLRRAGLYRDLEHEFHSLPDRTREALDWYCQGVNDGLVDAGTTLPMWVTGFRPRPWEPTSVLLIGKLLSFAGLTIGEQENERLLLELIQLGVDDERLRELFTPYLDGIDFEPLREIRIAKRMSDETLELLADLPRLAGSNAWAVSPAQSATGHAMLASDPHLEVNRLPPVWYEIAIRWGDGEYAMGATLPGCPIMAVGRTRRLSWGVTYMHADTSDFFIEDCRPGGSTGWQYRRGDCWFDYQRREEVIRRKGDEPIVMHVYENEQGILSSTPDAAEGPGKYLSVSWIGADAEGGRAISTWLDVIGAPSTAAAMEAVRGGPHPSLVWLFADNEGHIGLQASGWLPVRGAGNSGIVPVAAWDAENHWQGRVRVDLLPREYDPAIGFVASANEELYRRDGPPLHAHAQPDYRKRRIVERLTELPKATVVDMQNLQYDVLSVQARDLLPVLLALVDDCPLKEKLSAWDCRYTPTSTEAALFQHFYRHVVLQIFGNEQGIGWRRMFYLATRMGYSTMVLTAIDRTLRKVTSSWWRGRSKKALVQRAAEFAQKELVKPWSEFNAFHFVNRFFGSARGGRLLGFRSRPIAMPGCHATPFQGHLMTTATRETTFAPTYHFVTDMGTDEAWTNLPGGPSENRFSQWYKTDIPRWIAGEYKRLTPDGAGIKLATCIRIYEMSAPANDLSASRKRIAAAYSPAALETAGTRLLSVVADHLRRVESRETKVLNWNTPAALIDEARQFLTTGERTSPQSHEIAEITTRIAEIASATLAHGQNLHSPHYVGHQVPAPVPLAALFDFLGSVTNQVMAIYEMGPWATAVEHAVVDAVGEQLGFQPKHFSGLITSGGTLANLTGLLTARNVTLGNSWTAGLTGSRPAPVLVAHADAHYSVTRSAGILGLGTDQIVLAVLDSRRCIDANRLDDTLSGLRSRGVPIVAVSAASCATPVGAFDPLTEIAEVCRRHEVWLHVDAAHGGALAFSPRHRHLLDGIEQADSVVCDAHKMMFMPALCAMLFYRNPGHRLATFHQEAPYLFDPTAPELAEYDSGVANLECTKRAAAFGVWGVWSLLGTQIFADMVDVTIDLAQQFHTMLSAAEDFVPLHEPQCNIVAFRYLPPDLHDAPLAKIDALQPRLRRAVIESGAFYLVQSRIDGRPVLRTTMMNPLTTVDDLHGLLECLRRFGRQLIDAGC